MKQRWITAIALLAILIPSLYAGGIFFKVIATIFVIGGCYEILRLFADKWPKWTIVSIYLIFIASLAVAFNFKYFILFECVVILFLFFILVIYQEVSFEYIGLIFMILNIVTLTVASFDRMYSIDRLLLFYTCVANYVT
ncbi:MAG TPA: hypothetical protein PLI19_06690, partial [Erysipelotrichaceae bacterium]|nr:hypothetical protein [Erysipelotrichaceae bacterium]